MNIGDRAIGAGRPVVVIAEIGVNHNGDLDLARRSIDAAARAGAHACKFQNYRTEDFISDRSLTYAYETDKRTVVESQFDMFKRYELTPDDLAVLRDHSASAGLLFLSTPTSAGGIDDLLAVKADGVKNGSDYLTNLPLIAAMAESGLPTILATGMATLAEVDDAVRAYRAAGGTQLALLHCTSSYPTPMQDVHLRKIPTLARAFGLPVGLSDHTDGVVAAIGAVALGAAVIEKHFTLDKGLPGPDHHFSADEAELALLVEGVRGVEEALGGSEIGPTAIEAAGRESFRLSCVAATDLAEGHRLAPDDVAFRRPGTGLPPKGREWLTGRVLRHAVARGTVLTPADFA